MASEPLPFPQPPEMLGLTDWVEFLIINSICAYKPSNQYEMLTTPYQTPIKKVLGRFNVKKSNYNLFRKDNTKLISISYDDLIVRKTTYVLIKNSIKCKNIPNLNDLQMPSKNKLFRINLTQR